MSVDHEFVNRRTLSRTQFDITARWVPCKQLQTIPVYHPLMTDGTCFLCGETYTKRGMTRHLRSCLPEEQTGQKPVTVLRIAGEHRSDYWIHVAVDATTTLRTLDAFLRGFWLECCGHMSAFTLGDVRFVRPYSEEEMAARLGIRRESMDTDFELVQPAVDEEFGYEYDFGTTTALVVRVVEKGHWDLADLAATSEREDSVEQDGVVLLTRNDQRDRECATCGDPATEICQTCLRTRGPEALFCEECAEAHEAECDRPAYLPVVNSPRSGVCGYTG